MAHGRRFLFAQRRFRLRAEHGKRSAELVRRVGDEASLHGDGFADASHQLIDGVDQRGQFLRAVVRRQRREIARGAPRHLGAELAQGSEAPRHAEPDQRPSQHQQEQLLPERVYEDRLDQRCAAADGLCDLRHDGDRGRGRHGGEERRDADALAPVVRVVEDRLARHRVGRPRQVLVAGHERVAL